MCVAQELDQIAHKFGILFPGKHRHTVLPL
jgi:hypothetical protein